VPSGHLKPLALNCFTRRKCCHSSFDGRAVCRRSASSSWSKAGSSFPSCFPTCSMSDAKGSNPAAHSGFNAGTSSSLLSGSAPPATLCLPAWSICNKMLSFPAPVQASPCCCWQSTISDARPEAKLTENTIANCHMLSSHLAGNAFPTESGT